ncbi:inosine-5'-monophosphate dehydrogenase, partial [mine drainage metagenome]
MGGKGAIKFGQFTSTKEPVNIVCSSLQTELQSLKEEDPLEKAASLMTKNHVHLAAIVDDENKLVGIVEMNMIVDFIAGSTNNEGLLVNISGLKPGEEDLYEITYFL